MNANMPERPVKVKPKKCHEPWISPSIQRSMRKLKALYKETLKLTDKSVTTDNVLRYKEYREYTAMIKTS